MENARPPASVISKHADAPRPFSTADLYDRYMDDPRAGVQVAAFGLISFGGRKSYSGQITTVAGIGGVPLRIKDILCEPGRGRVLVADGHGAAAECALFGDRMASLGLSNGWAGIVLHGYVRDVTILRNLAVGVHALGSIPSRPRWSESIAIQRDTPLEFQRVCFYPGHWLYADEDGLLVAEQELRM